MVSIEQLGIIGNDTAGKLCDECKNKIAANYNRWKIIKGVMNPARFSHQVLQGLCHQCRRTVMSDARRLGGKQ